MQAQFIILIGDGQVRISRSSADREGRSSVVAEFPHHANFLPRRGQDLAELAGQLTGTLESHLPSGARGRMIIPAGWCLIHQIQVPETDARGAGAAFEFEQYATVPLEELTCCSWQIDKSTSLVVAVCTEPMQRLLAAIERSGFTVECVSVDLCVLAVKPYPGSGASKGLLHLDEHHASLSLMDGGAQPSRIIRTLRVPQEGGVDHVRTHVAQSLEILGQSVADWQLVSTGNRWSADELARMIPEHSRTTQQLDVDCAVSHIADEARLRNDLLNLRVGSLQSSRKWRPLSKQLERCAQCALILLVVLTLRWVREGARYAAAGENLHSEQMQLYQRVFPDSPLPSGSALRLQSERIKLEGLTERDGIGESPAGIGGMEAFALLHELTDRLPRSARLSVEEVVLERDAVRVAGLTTSHQVAGDWVRQLNESPILRADPPRTKLQADATVEFRVQVKRVEGHENP